MIPVPDLQDSSRPRLAVGCRWTGSGEKRTLVFPEGMLRLHSTAFAILERCDGRRTFQQIVQELQAIYSGSDPAKIHKDVFAFLKTLNEKRLVDFDD